MSQQEITISLKIPIKVVRKAYVLLDEDVPSDEDIISKLDCKKVDTESLGPAGEELRLGLSLLIIGEVGE